MGHLSQTSQIKDLQRIYLGCQPSLRECIQRRISTLLPSGGYLIMQGVMHSCLGSYRIRKSRVSLTEGLVSKDLSEG